MLSMSLHVRIGVIAADPVSQSLNSLPKIFHACRSSNGSPENDGNLCPFSISLQRPAINGQNRRGGLPAKLLKKAFDGPARVFATHPDRHHIAAVEKACRARVAPAPGGVL